MPHFVYFVVPIQKKKVKERNCVTCGQQLTAEQQQKIDEDELNCNSHAKVNRQSYASLEPSEPSSESTSTTTTTAVVKRRKFPFSRKVIRPLSRTIMAPFKLFRMGQGSASRSTSQETPDQSEPATPANLVITTTQNSNKLTTVMTSSAHYLNIDESETSENSSLMSLNSDQRALLSTGSTVDQIGYSSPQLSEIPISPPPSYETVMKENQLLAGLDKENNTIQTTIHTNLLVDNFYQTSNGSNNNLCLSEMDDYTVDNVNPSSTTMRGENLLIDGSECSMEECNNTNCNYNMNNDNENGGYGYDEHCLENDFGEQCNLNDSSLDNHHHLQQHRSNECSNCTDECSDECQNQYQDDYSDQYYNEDGSSMRHQQSTSSGALQQMSYVEPNKGPEILYKSSKQLYKAVARQCGIQCKMTDTCRCVDCQSRYFDCEFDQNENDKTDGGLGAGNGDFNYGTPMFVNEVLHGTACTIL